MRSTGRWGRTLEDRGIHVVRVLEQSSQLLPVVLQKLELKLLFTLLGQRLLRRDASNAGAVTRSDASLSNRVSADGMFCRRCLYVGNVGCSRRGSGQSLLLLLQLKSRR